MPLPWTSGRLLNIHQRAFVGEIQIQDAFGTGRRLWPQTLVDFAADLLGDDGQTLLALCAQVVVEHPAKLGVGQHTADDLQIAIGQGPGLTGNKGLGSGSRGRS